MSNEMQHIMANKSNVPLTIDSFVYLFEYTNSEEYKEKYTSATYIIPKRLNQRILEAWFSLQKGCCVDGREPTVMQYDNNSTKIAICKTVKI